MQKVAVPDKRVPFFRQEDFRMAAVGSAEFVEILHPIPIIIIEMR
jgi:hypothetical protein